MALIKRKKPTPAKAAPAAKVDPPKADPPKPAVPRAGPPKQAAPAPISVSEPPKPAVPRAVKPAPALTPAPAASLVAEDFSQIELQVLAVQLAETPATLPDVQNPVVPRAKPSKLKIKIDPKDRVNYPKPDDYWKVFGGRGEIDDNPVPLSILYAHFPPVYDNGKDIPSEVWVQNNYGIIYKFTQVSERSRVDVIRARNKEPKLEMNYFDGEIR